MSQPTRLSSQSIPYLINEVPYKDASALYTSGSGVVRSGSGSGFRQKNGIAVTVTIPPTLRAFKFPNVVNGAIGTPYISNTDRKTVADRNEWYKAARAQVSSTKSIANIQRQINYGKKRLAQAKSQGDSAAVKLIEEKLATLTTQLAKAKEGQNTKLLNQYSTEFEISDFITSMSWSASDENSFITLNITLDNIQNLFTYLPEAAKVTVWRRKSTTNLAGGNRLYAGKWYRYITTYVLQRNRSFEGRNQTMELVCGDRGSFLKSHLSTKKVWKKDSTHKNGWTPRQITIDVCKREGIPYNPNKLPSRYPVRVTKKLKNGKISASLKWITIPALEYTPESEELEVVLGKVWNDAMAKIPAKYQVPHILHFRRGALEVEFASPPGSLLMQSEAGQKLVATFTDNNIESAQLDENIEPETVFTVLKAKGSYSVKKTNARGRTIKSLKTVTKTFYPSGTRGKLIIDAYGKRVKNYKYKKPFKNEKEFTEAAQRKIDKISRPVRTLTIDGRAPLGIWPVYHVFINSRNLGVKGNLMVRTVNYSIDNGMIRVNLVVDSEYKYYSSGENAFKYPRPELYKWY